LILDGQPFKFLVRREVHTCISIRSRKVVRLAIYPSSLA
jgi:hypothetical protein